MAIITHWQYNPPFWAKSGHLNTFATAVLRRAKPMNFQRERISLPDGDFLDLDWSRISDSNDKLCIGLHGLEGNARRPYLACMLARGNAAQYDTVGMNFRGCSGEHNHQLYAYHTGKSEDLDAVIQHILKNYPHYKQITLIGFSAGGNILLKYLGERGNNIPKQIYKAVAFSVPCDLASCSKELAKRENALYMFNFLKTLKEKAQFKYQKYPNSFDLKAVMAARDFGDFDEAFTAPLNGFKNAAHYWKSASCVSKLGNIQIPTLLVSAKDDSFLNEDCFPFDVAAKHPFFDFHLSRYGGHVGFWGENRGGWLWSEEIAWTFIVHGL